MTDNMTANIALEKQMLRKQLHGIDLAISSERKHLWDTDILNVMLASALYTYARCIALFIPFSDEPDIWPVISDAWKRKKIVITPRIEGEKLVFRKTADEGDLEIGLHNVHQPKRTCPSVPRSSVDTYVIPGQAFDRKGNRLGRGQGYYDRYLKKVRKPVIGLCYGFRLVDDLPCDSRDRKVDGIITEGGYIDLKS